MKIERLKKSELDAYCIELGIELNRKFRRQIEGKWGDVQRMRAV